jgi:hypothetical protein
MDDIKFYKFHLEHLGIHNEEFRNLYDSPIIIRVIKSRMMGWTMYVERIWAMTNAYSILVENTEGKR